MTSIFFTKQYTFFANQIVLIDRRTYKEGEDFFYYRFLLANNHWVKVMFYGMAQKELSISLNEKKKSPSIYIDYPAEQRIKDSYEKLLSTMSEFGTTPGHFPQGYSCNLNEDRILIIPHTGGDWSEF